MLRHMGGSARDVTDAAFGAYDGFTAPADGGRMASSPHSVHAPLLEIPVCLRVCSLDFVDDANFHTDIIALGRVCGRPLLSVAVHAMRGVRRGHWGGGTGGVTLPAGAGPGVRGRAGVVDGWGGGGDPLRDRRPARRRGRARCCRAQRHPVREVAVACASAHTLALI